jgi:hypothetical protein
MGNLVGNFRRVFSCGCVALVSVENCRFPMKWWCARQDSNLWPTAPEAVETLRIANIFAMGNVPGNFVNDFRLCQTYTDLSPSAVTSKVLNII